MTISLRPLRLPEEYGPLAGLLSSHWSEPTTAERLREDDAKLYETGHTWLDEQGRLAGYDRDRTVAVDDRGELAGYAWTWRAPWTEPGFLCLTLIVAQAGRRRGAGRLLLRRAAEWAAGLGGGGLLTELWDDQPEAMRFAERYGFAIDRHAFQSVLKLDGAAAPRAAERALGEDAPERLERTGIRFVTLAELPDAEAGERKLYDLYRATLPDIPGFLGDVPAFGEWRKWHLQVDGFAPESVLIAADGETFVGVTNVLYNPATNGMYHEYTGVDRASRGRGIARALKVLAIRLAIRRGAAYIRTDNDAMNKPILAINESLGYEPLRGTYRVTAPLDAVLRRLDGTD